MSLLRASLHVTILSALAMAAFGCSASATGGEEGASSSSEAISALPSNAHAAYTFFVNKGLTRVQSAAIVGNLIQESSVSPTIHEGGGGPGRGIAQWSSGGRWNVSSHDNVVWFAGTHGGSATSLGVQLDFIWYELQTFSGYGLSRLRASSTISSATVAFQNDYEVCGACNQSARIHSAQQVLNAFGSGAASSSSGGGSSGGSGSVSTPPPETGAGCYSSTLGREVEANTCVQSSANDKWYQCDDGAWVDRFGDRTACSSTHPL